MLVSTEVGSHGRIQQFVRSRFASHGEQDVVESSLLGRGGSNGAKGSEETVRERNGDGELERGETVGGRAEESERERDGGREGKGNFRYVRTLKGTGRKRLPQTDGLPCALA